MIFVPKRKFDVAIIGWWHNSNYGSIMTYYALNKAIIDLGYSTLLVHESLGYPNRWKLPSDAPGIEFAKRQGFNYKEQNHFSENIKLNEIADTFVVGSDQLWNPYIARINDDLFLNFTNPEKKRIAYGTSIGNFNLKKFQSNHFAEDFEKVQKQNLKRFDSISMREDDGIAYLKKTFNLDAIQVVDPVFLIDPLLYHKLANNTTKKIEGRYMMAFILDPSEEKKRVVQAIADKLQYEHIAVYTDANRNQLIRAKEIFHEPNFIFDEEIRVENWLSAYKNAEYVVTDSFHGSAFAYIFKKPFSVFFNKLRGVNRFASLMRLLRLDDSRRVYEENTDNDIFSNNNVSMQIDFSFGDENLFLEKSKSLKWLRDALKNEKSAEKILQGASMSANQESVVDQDLELDLIGDLTKKSFVYYRDGQRAEPLAKGVKLSKTGEITGIKNSIHSLYWVFKNSKLEFQDKNRQSTTIFDVKIKSNDFLDIRGSFIPNKKIIHILEEEESWQKNVLIDIINSQRLVVGRIFRDDMTRYSEAYALKWKSRNIGNARALMMFYAHAVEKGLSHANFRPGFGKEVVPQLARETGKWVENYGSSKDPFFKIATSVMHAYFERHEKLHVDVSSFWNLFTLRVQQEIKKAQSGWGGVVPVKSVREDIVIDVPHRSFLDVAFSRRSVRTFSSKPVGEADVIKAVRIAMQAPSVCNRQPARVYQISNVDKIKKALEIQVGFRGYAPPSKLLLVTVDLTVFLYAAERNQAYIDGGLFMMMLLLGLEQVGLGACCLNTAMNPEQQDSLRSLLNIPSTEVLIAFAAIGYFDESAVVPRSKRLSVNDILVNI